MVDKETTEFSRGSFKEKILRQLEENAAKQAETKFPDPEDFERPKGSEPVTSERKIEPRKVELEPFKLPVFKFPEADEEEDFQAQVDENTSQETGSLRQKLEEIVSDENQEQTFPPPFSRSESAVQEERLRHLRRILLERKTKIRKRKKLRQEKLSL